MLGKLQFGVYELDRDAMELRKHGVPIRLQEQPFRILAALVERPGQIVTREELRELIWGKDTFVDFEQSLNKAVNRVREALNDDAGRPQYVETIPRRGYRFIAPVTGIPSTKPSGTPAQRFIETLRTRGHRFIRQVTGNRPPAEASLNRLRSPRYRVRLYFATTGCPPTVLVTVLICVFGLALAVIVSFGWLRRAGPSSTGYVMLAVLPFQNLSGDPSQDYFSDGLTEEMISQLGALSPDQLGVIARTTTMAYKHTSKSVQQIGSELGVGYVLESSVRRDGDQVRISVQLIRAHDQVHVWST